MIVGRVLWSLVGALVLGACGDPSASVPEPPYEGLQGEPCEAAPGTVDTEAVDGECQGCACIDGAWDCFPSSCGAAIVPEPKAELLLVVDDSSSMGPDRQARLALGVQALAEILEGHPDPVHLRVAITTTDGGNPVCDPATADDGAFLLRSCQEHLQDFAVPATPTEAPIPDDAAQRGCLDVCGLDQLRTLPTTTAVDSTPRARPWLERWYGRTNVEGQASLGEALACAVPQGVRGCDFESPLHTGRRAMQRALEPGDPAEGFFDETADMKLLLVTDEADCSYQAEWETVFDPEGSRRFWSDPQAEAPTSAVCWNAGVRCEGGPGQLDGCEAINIDTAEHEDIHDDNAILTPINELVHHIDEARREVGDFQLVALAGVPAGYGLDPQVSEIVYTDGSDDPEHLLTYGTGPGCAGSGGETAVPPVRMLAVAERFHTSPTLYSTCDADYSPALSEIARGFIDGFDLPCYPACAADLDPQAPGLQPRCYAQARRPEPSGGFVVEAVPECTGDGTTGEQDVCVVMRHDDTLGEACGGLGYNLEVAVRRNPDAPQSSAGTVEVVCEHAADREVSCPGL